MRLLTLTCLALMTGSATAQRPEVAPTWTLVEDLRIGGEDAGPKSFNNVRSIVATKSGNIFVLDTKTKEIRVFDAKGNFLRLAARDGAGPGEIRNANGLAIGKDDVVWTNDPSNARMAQYRADGTFLRQTLIPINSYGYMWSAVIDDKGRVVDPSVWVQTSKVDPETKRPIGEPRVRIVVPDGKVDTVAYPTCQVGATGPTMPLHFKPRGGGVGDHYRELPFSASPRVAFTTTGMAWCTPSSEYRLFAGPIGGALKEVVNLKVAPTPVPPEKRKRELEIIDSVIRNYGPLVRGDPESIPKTQPVIAAIHADDQGRIWVRRTDAALATPSYDVFDTSGKAVAHVESRGKVGTMQVFIGGGYLYTTITDDDDVPVIVRYRIVRQ